MRYANICSQYEQGDTLMNKDSALASLAARNPLSRPMQHSSHRRKFLKGVAAGMAAAALPTGIAAQASRPLSLLTWDA